METAFYTVPECHISPKLPEERITFLHEIYRIHERPGHGRVDWLLHSSTGTGPPHMELAALRADEVPRAGGLAIRACHPAARQSGDGPQQSLRRILGGDSFLRSKFVSTLYATGVHLVIPRPSRARITAATTSATPERIAPIAMHWIFVVAEATRISRAVMGASLFNPRRRHSPQPFVERASIAG